MHNHVTRDIKPPGQCPDCDGHWASLPPVRLCCGQRHAGVICPDGLVQCCICFRRFGPLELHRTPGGDLEDVCIACGETEDAYKAAHP